MNKILDYEQVLQSLDKLTKNTYITKQKPIGYSTFNLPIHYYTYGSGKNNIVITGATHGCEIISTDLVLNLIKNIPNQINPNQYTIHFIPCLNPEGYLISTSAIRALIPRNMPNKDAQIIIKEYITKYNSGNLTYQNMFSNVDYTYISDKYLELKNNIKNIYIKYNIPKGTMQVWSANGNGVDLNQNCPYNQKIDTIKSNTIIYGHSQYKNIIITNPGPIGCPYKNKEFEYEPETKAFRNFILNLKHSTNLCAYLNYHSAEDTVFYKPLIDIKTNETITDIKKLTIYNKKLAKIYIQNTTQQLYEGKTNIYCFNDMLRTEIPGDILIELSPNEGNPLSAYEDTVYEKTIMSNTTAAINLIKQLPLEDTLF